MTAGKNTARRNGNSIGGGRMWLVESPSGEVLGVVKEITCGWISHADGAKFTFHDTQEQAFAAMGVE